MKKLLQKTLILALLSVVGVNANAATKTIFSVSADQTATDDYKQPSDQTTKAWTDAGRATVMTGCEFYVVNTSSTEKYYTRSMKTGSETKYWFCVVDNNVLYKLVLSEPIKAGDVISADLMTNADKDTEVGLAFQSTEVTARPASIPSTCISATLSKSSSNATYTVKATDTDLINKDELYIYRYTNANVYFDNLTIIREQPSSTACTINEASGVAYGLNPTSPEELPTTGTDTKTATWGGDAYTLTLTTEDTGAGLRAFSNTTSARQIVIDETEYRPIIVNKSQNGIYSITKSANVKSITLYAKTNSTSDAATMILDMNVSGKQTAATTLPLLEETAASFDVTDRVNFRVSAAVVIALKVEYYTGVELTVADINWASLYLPIAVTLPEGMKAYYASAINSSTVTLTELNAIPANTGVVVNAEADTYTLPVATSAVEAPAVNKFSGVTEDATTSSLGDIYVLSGSANDKATPKFATYSGTTLGAYKAYIDKAANNLTALKLDFTIDGATVVDNIAEQTVKSIAVKKYFAAGQLVIEKDGKKYSAAGAEIK